MIESREIENNPIDQEVTQCQEVTDILLRF